MSKPRKGDEVTCLGKTVGIVSEVDGSICWYCTPDGEANCFIWRFNDGLNNLHDWPGKEG